MTGNTPSQRHDILTDFEGVSIIPFLICLYSLGNLDNVFKRREANCAKEDPQLWTATTWLRDHRKELKDYVYDPIRLLISAKDRKYAKVAEATINYATMKVCLP